MTDFTNTVRAAIAAAKHQGAKEITTAKHARYLAEAARKRAEKFRTQAIEADGQAAKYDELAATLPESSPSTSTGKARVLDGVVKARKDGEDGKPEAYKIAVGEGFDEELFTVQPGAILLAGESAEANEAAEGL